MSERILKALVQLFAIVAESDTTKSKRKIVEAFLAQQLSQELVEEYLSLYDDYVSQFEKSLYTNSGDLKRKRTSLSSVRILRICTEINSELTQVQKIIVLLRIFEYLFSEKSMTEQEKEFAETVAGTFRISAEEYLNCLEFITSKQDSIPNSPSFLLVNKTIADTNNKFIVEPDIDLPILFLRIESVNLFFFKYFGIHEINLNGQAIISSRSYILNRGASLRGNKLKTIYYSDIQKCFLTEVGKPKITFAVKDVEYKFKNGNSGIKPLSFQEESGKLIAIMGGSGAGKSTLLNILNGNIAPTKGKILINGFDIYKEKDKIEGIIGYVSQDDLLIEELTVYENLFYNAKLCFKDLSNNQLDKLVIDLLNSLGLEEIKHLKVGNPIDKIISGGQRKRVNIGLELLREPAVLFADEPTSGLSSRDSENIMDLLKELTLKGKLVFVVIHQPSSDIFKMFDQLLILDLGGYPVYYGNPVDAVIYFKTIINHVNANESECKRCGNVNPEQIFNTLESKILDEYGNVTDQRKISPKEWNDYYLKDKNNSIEEIVEEKSELPQSTFNVPSKLKQFNIFLIRDLLSKLTNTQYLLINLLETPILAFILAFFIRFYDTDVDNQMGYTFMDNENIPVYLFMSVVVSLFIGMTVSAEEIIRDQKIRKRESFLNLSNGSYLFSKIVLMFSVSAIQTLLFILIGNTILGIHGMYSMYWLVLFSTACFANMVGLNISATLNSAVTIYILIPFLLIPQLLFSGIIVKFDKLNPVSTSQKNVPLIGDLMASRWAFEALAVYQYKENSYEKMFYSDKKMMSIANYKKNFWIPKLQAKVNNIESVIKRNEDVKDIESDLRLLKNEFLKEKHINKHFLFSDFEQIHPQKINLTLIESLKDELYKLNIFYVKMFNKGADRKDKIIQKFYANHENGKNLFNELKVSHENTALSDLLTNKKDLRYILELNDELIQKTDPIFLDSDGFRAHFYAPRKKIFGKYFFTPWVNIFVLWMMSFMLTITLYFDFFKKLLNIFSRLFSSSRKS